MRLLPTGEIQGTHEYPYLTIVVVNEYYEFMAGTPQEQAALSVIRTADLLMQRAMDVLKPHALSPVQYNVLRILRGAGKEGASCKQIGDRLIARDPDVTRMMDRLEKRGLLTRDRDAKDRRIVTHCLTKEGRDLVNKLDRPIERMHLKTFRDIQPAEIDTLLAILKKLQIEEEV
jgi:DNA-binding MarR family transcriptional regulator